MLTQLSVKGALAHVELLLSVSGNTIDLNEEIYTADVTIGKSMSFTLEGTVEEAGQGSGLALPTPAISVVDGVSVFLQKWWLKG